MKNPLTVEQLHLLTSAKIHKKENSEFSYDEAQAIVETSVIDYLINREWIELEKIHQVPVNYLVIVITRKGEKLLEKLLTYAYTKLED